MIDFINKIIHHFEKGGRLEKFQSTFDAFSTFLYVPDKVTSRGSHIRDNMDMKRTMAIVVFALLPAIIFGMWNAGYQNFLAAGEVKTIWQNFAYGFIQVFPIIVVAYVSGLATEFIFAQIRGHDVNEGFLVTGMLIPLILPVDIPLWMVAVATVFAVIIGKEVFGGTGMNILNPALTARAFLFFAYPSEMSGVKVWIEGLRDGKNIIDGFSGETILAQAASGNTDFVNGAGGAYTTSDMFLGFIPGSIGDNRGICLWSSLYGN